MSGFADEGGMLRSTRRKVSVFESRCDWPKLHNSCSFVRLDIVFRAPPQQHLRVLNPRHRRVPHLRHLGLSGALRMPRAIYGSSRCGPKSGKTVVALVRDEGRQFTIVEITRAPLFPYRVSFPRLVLNISLIKLFASMLKVVHSQDVC